MNEQAVWKVKVFSANYVSDFFQKVKNMFGGRLKIYEKVINKAISETYKEFKEDYPDAFNIKIDSEPFGDNAFSVMISGSVKK